MSVHCITGLDQTSKEKDFPGFDQDYTWLYPNGIANALSIVLVRKWYGFTHDSALKGAPSFVVHLVKYRMMRFIK